MTIFSSDRTCCVAQRSAGRVVDSGGWSVVRLAVGSGLSGEGLWLPVVDTGAISSSAEAEESILKFDVGLVDWQLNI